MPHSYCCDRFANIIEKNTIIYKEKDFSGWYCIRESEPFFLKQVRVLKDLLKKKNKGDAAKLEKLERLVNYCPFCGKYIGPLKTRSNNIAVQLKQYNQLKEDGII